MVVVDWVIASTCFSIILGLNDDKFLGRGMGYPRVVACFPVSWINILRFSEFIETVAKN